MPLYISKNNQQLGPFEESVVLEMIRNGEVLPEDFAMWEGQSQWHQLKILFPHISQRWSSSSTPQYTPPDLNTKIPNRSKPSEVLIIGLVGAGVMVCLSIIAVAMFFYFSSSSVRVSDEFEREISNVSTQTESKNNVGEAKFQSLKLKAEELAQFSPPVKLNPNASIKGKVAIIVKDRTDATLKGFDAYFNDYTILGSRETYGISKQRLATTPEEIDTLIQILCDKGKEITTFTGGIKGFENICKVSVIDYRKPTILAQETFTNDRPPRSISDVYKRRGEFVFLKPDNLIGEFINKIPLEKLTNPTKGIVYNNFDGNYGKYQSFKDIAPELGKVVLPIKLDSNAKVKGKVAIAQISPEGESELKVFDAYGKGFNDYDLKSFGLTNNQIAVNEEEIETVVRINCRKGDLIKTVSKTSVYSNKCEVSIIDYKASVIIAQTSFENKIIYGEIDTNIYPIQYIAIPPTTQIQQYIKGFAKE